MNNKKEFDSIYNIEVQRILLSFLIEDADVFVRCRNILKDVYFDEQLRRAVRFILSHTDEHKAIPNPLLIQAKTGVEIKRLADFANDLDKKREFRKANIVNDIMKKVIKRNVL